MARVELLNVGWFTCAAGLMHRGDPFDEPLRFPIPAYVVETDDQLILVDTGLHPAAAADSASHYAGIETMGVFTLEQEVPLSEQVDLGALTMVVMTHLHFDHAGALTLIPESVPIVIQRCEWEGAHDDEATKRNSFIPRDYDIDEGRLMLVEGDHDLLGDGSIELLSTPGHTLGHQSVRVGDLVIGGDVSHFPSGLEDHRFPMFADNHGEQARSAERLRGLRDQGLTIMPGHDPDVLVPGPLS